MQLRQRISTVCHIESLSLEETVGYIDYRVKMAGYLAEPLFTAGAVKLIAEASHGTPRTINNLCYNSLALCCKMKLKQVDAAMVSKVIASLQLTPPVHAPTAAGSIATATPVRPPRCSRRGRERGLSRAAPQASTDSPDCN